MFFVLMLKLSCDVGKIMFFKKLYVIGIDRKFLLLVCLFEVYKERG